MAKPHGTDAAGQPVNLVGGLITTGRGAVTGIPIVTKEDANVSRVPESGIYTLNGRRFKARKGDILPEGAEMEVTADQRAEQQAPENKAKKAAPENRAAGKKDE